MSSRFRFRGYAIGAAGEISQPFSDIIEVQAASALPQLGGYGSSRSAAFQYREFVKFDLAHTEVSGARCRCDGERGKTSFSTRITSTIEGLNIMGMITADRVVATVASTYTPAKDAVASVKLFGTRFDNLKIGGQRVDVDLAIDVFDKLDTHRSLTQAYQKEEEKDLRQLFDKLTLRDRANEAPAEILGWFHHLEGGAELPPADGAKVPPKLPSAGGVTSVSLVRAMTSSMNSWGHVIPVPGFGTVRLAEVEISHTTRNVTMIQVDLDCPHKARFVFCEVADGGDGYGFVDDGDDGE